MDGSHQNCVATAAKRVFTKDVLSFLGVSDLTADSCNFTNDVSIRSDFVPAFLNALRDVFPLSRIRNRGSPLHATKSSPGDARSDSDSSESGQNSPLETNTKEMPEGKSKTTSLPNSPTNTTGSVQAVSATHTVPTNKILLENGILVGMDKKRHRRKPRSERKNPKPQILPNMDDLDAFPPLGGSVSRRITPTPVSVQPHKDANRPGILFSSEKRGIQTNIIFQSSPLKECRNTSLQEERELLRRARKSQSHDRAHKMVEMLPVIKKSSSVNAGQVSAASWAKDEGALQDVAPEMIAPDPEKVTDKAKIDLVVEAYVCMINLKLVPNITTELYYLFQMLMIQMPVNTSVEGNKLMPANLFDSVHNCVYFAVSTLSRLGKLTKILDGTTLKLLANNPSVNKFNCDFANQLKDLNGTTSMTRLGFPTLEGVSFQPDTDSKENFPTDLSFQKFKKQRDLFYKLLLDWESHKSPDWSKDKHFEKQVHGILSLSTEPTNFAHLARLFQMQMLITCTGFGELDSKDPELLEELRRSHPVKYEKLHERFLAPLQLESPCPPPSFPGTQQFFHDFLKVGSSAMLNQHLIDVIAAKIAELDKAELIPSDYDEDIRDEVQSNVFSTIQILRLLGKFLGFLVFFPYQTQYPLPAELVTKNNALRSVTQPTILVSSYLEKSIEENRMLLTVPWIVEYLSMMDPGAPNLPHLRSAISTLFRIYHEELDYMSETTCLYLQLLLGWLFDTPNFPQSRFFEFPLTKLRGCRPHSGNCKLDTMDLVDQNLIYASCTHLIVLKTLLREKSPDTQTKHEVRKITPVRAEDEANLLPSPETIQEKLEENFFNNQPTSIKNVVDFVADRIRSKLVNRIRHTIVPKFVNTTRICVREMIGPIVKQSNQPSIRKSLLPDQELQRLAVKLFERYVNDTRSYVNAQCSAEVKKAILPLLPEDALDVVKETCYTICERITKEKTEQWIKSNISLQYIKTEIADECKCLCYKSQEEHNTNEMCERKPSLFTISTLDFIFNVQSFMSDSYANDVSSERTKAMLEQIKDYLHLTFHSDVAIMQKMVKGLSVDLMMCLVVCHPKQITTELTNVFLEFWSTYRPQKLFVNVVSPRNVQLLSASVSPVESWYAYEMLVGSLIQSQMLSPGDFESGCLNVMKQQWVHSIQIYFNAFLVRIHRVQNCWQPTRDFLNSQLVRNWSIPTSFSITEFLAGSE